MAKIFIIDTVNITISPQPNGLLGFATISINQALKLGSIGIWKSTDSIGYRITYPTKGPKECEVFHPTDRDLHEQILTAIVQRIKEAQ